MSDHNVHYSYFVYLTWAWSWTHLR